MQQSSPSMLLPRTAVSPGDTWDLSPLFADNQSWELEYSRLSRQFPTVADFCGKLGQSPQIVAQALECYLGLARDIEKLYVFANLKSDEDSANTANLGLLQRASKLSAEFSAAASFIIPEVLALDQSYCASLLAASELLPLRRMLQDILRFKPHTLGAEQEQLLALGSEIFSSAGRIFGQLLDADMVFGEITVGAEKKPLTHSTLITFLKNPDRKIRQLAHQQYYENFSQHQHSLAAMLASSIKKDVYLSQVRHFPSALEASLFADNVPATVYENLISAVSHNVSVLHDYYQRRAKHLQLEQSAIFDTYVPLVSDTSLTHSYPEAVEVVCEALRPLGSEYVDTLRLGLRTKRWVDVYENQGKRSGAYSSGCYDSPPYILLNYKSEELHDLFTLAHEAGHSMHTWLSSAKQSYQDHQYSIVVAEVASTLNEILLANHLLKQHRGDTKLEAYLLNQQLDDIKSTFFRQTMFAEFERTTHALEQSGAPLTIDHFRAEYRLLLEKYFGPSVKLERHDELECLRIPHFYSAFYVYKYATGLAAAHALAKPLLDGDKDALRRYLEFLSSGCAKFPLDLLRDAGVDLETEEPVIAVIEKFKQLQASFFANLT